MTYIVVPLADVGEAVCYSGHYPYGYSLCARAMISEHSIRAMYMVAQCQLWGINACPIDKVGNTIKWCSSFHRLL